MGDRGRVVVPAEIRARHGLEPGTPIVWLETAPGLMLVSLDELEKLVHDDYRGLGLVDSLIADRRLEAERDWREAEEYKRRAAA